MLRFSLLALLAASGLSLTLLPWLYQPRRPMPAPERFDAGHPAYGGLLAAASAVDAHCRKGDLARLRAWVTPACLRRIEARLAESGQALTPKALSGQFLVGRIADRVLLAAGAKDNRAVLVHARDRSDLGATGFLSSMEFVWDGHRWRFDRRDFRRAEATGDLATAYLQELLF